EPGARYSSQVEAVAYFVVSEALANVAKYAGADLVHVRAAWADGALRVEIADDGRGGADAAAGSGIRGLIDRVSAVDGTLDVASPRGGGTRLVATIPSPAPVRPPSLGSAAAPA
ncbi:MAG TPA: ATP-binding protein, partial [Candidatus Limnocylindrales bacterium]|nr:ATP-binding protein [Candidatus Limnocylindrales bacterium]